MDTKNKKKKGDLSKYLGGLSGKAADSLRGRKRQLDSQIERATGGKGPKKGML